MVGDKPTSTEPTVRFSRAEMDRANEARQAAKEAVVEPEPIPIVTPEEEVATQQEMMRQAVAERTARETMVTPELEVEAPPTTPELEIAGEPPKRPIVERSLPSEPIVPVEGMTTLRKQLRLVEYLQKAIEVNELPDNPQGLRQLADSILGGEFNQDTDIDLLYDALEGASHAAERGKRVAGETLEQAIDRAIEAESRLVNRTRTLEVSELQQFSTPMPIAEGAAYSANVKAGDKVLEPSAGTGSLLEPLRGKNAVLLANDLDPNRVNILRKLGYQAAEGDALLLNKIDADVIVTNPPWGAYSTRKYGKVKLPFAANDVSQRHIYAMARNLKEGGRLVAVMPTNMVATLSRQTGEWTAAGGGFRKWLDDKFTVRALVQSPPGTYNKRGTTVDSVLLVADKGKVADAPQPIIAVAEQAPQNFQQYIDTIRPLGEGGSHARISLKPSAEVAPVTQPTPSTTATEIPDVQSRDTTAGPVPGTPGGRQRAVSRERPGGDGGVHGGAQGVDEPTRPRTDTDVVSVETSEVRGPLRDRGGIEPTAETPGITPDVGKRPGRTPGGRKLAGAVDEAAERVKVDASQVYAGYKGRRGQSRAPHPGIIVESRSLSGTPYPTPTHKVHPKVEEAIEKKLISDHQYDDIVAIGSASQQGHGILIADDVGTGKSRIIAGAVIDKLESGTCQRLLITTKSGVNVDDLIDEIHNVYGGRIVDGKLVQAEKAPYDIITVRDYKGAKKEITDEGYEPLPLTDRGIYLVDSYNFADYCDSLRAVQLDGWFADEAHVYRNPDKKRGITWQVLHEDLRLRGKLNNVAYLTATPAQTIDDLRQLYALQEWRVDNFEEWKMLVTGQKTEAQVKAAEEAKAKHFDEIMQEEESMGVEADEAMIKATTSWGVSKGREVFESRVSSAEMEQIMRELKRKGKYLSKDLWRGGVEFDAVETKLTPEQNQSYDTTVSFMRKTEDAFQRYKSMNASAKRATSAGVKNLFRFNTIFSFAIFLSQWYTISVSPLPLLSQVAKGLQQVLL